MPQSPSTSTRASRPVPFPSYTSHNARHANPTTVPSRSKSTSPAIVSTSHPESSRTGTPIPTGRHTFNPHDYQSFGFSASPMPSLSSYDASLVGTGGMPFPSMSTYTGHYPSVNPLAPPFAYLGPQTTLTSPVISGPSSSTSQSPDHSFRDRYDSPELYLDDDDDNEADDSTRHTTPPPVEKKISRPPNAWILYRSDRIREYNEGGTIKSAAADEEVEGSKPKSIKAGKKVDKTKKSGKGYTQAEISRLIALEWKNEPKDVKARYDRLAEIKKMEHQRDFPDYKYQPMRKEEKVRMKEARDREKALARKERALDRAMRAIIAPRKSRAKPKAVPPPPSRSPSPVATPALAPAPSIQSGFDASAYRDPVQAEEPKQKVNARASKKTTKKARKTPGSTKSKKPHVLTDPRDCGIMDGAQVFWAGPPDLPTSYVAPAEPNASDIRADGEGGMQGASTVPSCESHQGGLNTWTAPNADFALPLPEAGLAIDARSIVPYIFEPAPFPEPLLEADFQPFYGSDHYGYTQLHSTMNAQRPDATSLRPDPLPPVEVPGVTESELVEMWGLLEDENVGYDLNGAEDTGNAPATLPNWSADPTELVNQWADLGAPIEEPAYITPRNYSGSVASQIASDWQNQPYHSLQPDNHTGFPLYGYQSVQGHRYPPAYPPSYPGSTSYPSSRPGYVTIEVPVSSLQDPYRSTTTYPNVPQGPPLAQATPLSPVNGSFPSVEGWSGAGGQSQGPVANMGQAENRSYHRRTNEPGAETPFPTFGLPLEHRAHDNRQTNVLTPTYVHPTDGTFEYMQGRRVSELGSFDHEGSLSGWTSPAGVMENGRMPSFGDFRLPSGSFMPFPDQDLDYAPPEPLNEKRLPTKKARVVAGQHAPPPQRIVS